MKKMRPLLTLSLLGFLALASCSGNTPKPGPGPEPGPVDPYENYKVIETMSKRMPAEFEPSSSSPDVTLNTNTSSLLIVYS